MNDEIKSVTNSLLTYNFRHNKIPACGNRWVEGSQKCRGSNPDLIDLFSLKLTNGAKLCIYGQCLFS